MRTLNSTTKTTFKTLLAGISCLVCFQALGDCSSDCTQIELTSQDDTCLKGLFLEKNRIMSSGRNYQNVEQTSEGSESSSNSPSSSITWPNSDCANNSIYETQLIQGRHKGEAAAILKTLDEFAQYCASNCNNTDNSTPSCDPTCAPTLTYPTNQGTSSTTVKVTCDNVGQTKAKYNNQINIIKNDRCKSIEESIEVNSASGNTRINGIKSCRSGYLQKIWQTPCKSKSTTSTMLSAKDLKQGWNCTTCCSTNLCHNLSLIQSNCNNFFSMIEDFKNAGLIKNVKIEGDKASVTICGKQKEYAIPPCFDYPSSS